MIERLVGVQAQLPQSPYIGIWTRTTSFRRETLERELRKGAIVKATVTRQTLHLVTRRDYALLRAALSETNFPDQTEEAKRLAPAVRAFATNRPVTTARRARTSKSSTASRGSTPCERGAAPGCVPTSSTTTRRRSGMHGRPDASPPSSEPEVHDPTEARAEIVRRYLAAFGPATRRDIGAWSMMHVPEISRALERLEPLRRFRDEEGRELLDVPRGPLPAAETPAPVRFLPKWDNVLLSWADRTRVLPEEYRKTVIRMNGDVAPTFLVDGFVAGTWRVEGERVLAEPFEPLPATARREVADEAARLTAFLAATP